MSVLRLPDPWLRLLPELISYRLGGRDSAGWPVVCRALAADVRADGTFLVLASTPLAEAVLGAIAVSGRVSLVLASPRTNRTLHVKGRDATVGAPPPDWRALLDRRMAVFVDDLSAFDGFAGARFLDNWRRSADVGVRAVTFAPIGAWDQSPGPAAGQPIALEDA